MEVVCREAFELSSRSPSVQADTAAARSPPLAEEVPPPPPRLRPRDAARLEEEAPPEEAPVLRGEKMDGR